MNWQSSGDTNFDSLVSLPVDDTVAMIPPVLVAESYLCPDSPISQGLPSINRSYYGIVVSDSPDSPFGNAVDADGFYIDTKVPESEVSDSEEAYHCEMAEMELRYGWTAPTKVTRVSIETKAEAYLSTLRMMDFLLPKYIAKDAIDSRYYLAPAEIKQFLASSSINQVKKSELQVASATSLYSRTCRRRISQFQT